MTRTPTPIAPGEPASTTSTTSNESGLLKRLWARWEAIFEDEGSSRAFGLLRIALALIVWTRYANSQVFAREVSAIALIRSVAFFVLSTLMLVGLRSRLATAAMAVLLWLFYFYWGKEMGIDSWAHHHNYVLAMLVTILAMADSGRSYSLDRVVALRRARKRSESPPDELCPVWPRYLMMIQLSAVYFFGAFDKTTFAFLSGQRMEGYLVWFFLGFDYPQHWALPMLCMLAAIATVVLEYGLTAVPVLPRGRLRGLLIVSGIALHAAFYVILPVSTFSVTMVAAYLAYFDPGRIHDAIDRIHGWGSRAT